MIQLRLRSEYCFRRAFGRVEKVLDSAEGDAVATTDPGSWGHAIFYKAAKARQRRALLGCEVYVIPSHEDEKEKRGGVYGAFLARNQRGLEELYEWITMANQAPRFYHWPRLDYADINQATKTRNLVYLSGSGARIDLLRNRPNVYLEINPSNPAWNRRAMKEKGWSKVVCCDNLYPTVSDRVAWEILSGLGPGKKGLGAPGRTSPQHILNEDELRLACPEAGREEFLNTERIAAECDVAMPKATMVKMDWPKTLEQMCKEGCKRRGFKTHRKPSGKWSMADEVYNDRLWLELEMIHTKKFEDYFYVIADLVQEAKKHMLVGPARGSSAGSLVCYLLDITDVDPIVHDLMFERFIDITRADLPDIDIDFQDNKRELVAQHLSSRYGAERVGQLGTILTYKAKSAIGDVAKTVGIPMYEVADLKGAIIERSSGDARAQFCIADTFETLDIGKEMLKKYPSLALAGELEGHAQYSGTHAAGVIVTNDPVTRYAAIDHSGSAQIDKKSAEVLNILKIDALGLRTLSVLQDTLDQIGKDRDWLIHYPLDDTEAFEVFNEERFTGIFQYEGKALQILTKQMKIRSFDDVAVITALARPGPLHCGAANEFIARRIGASPVSYLHPVAKPFTEQTYGTVIYQEQVMMICRHIGQLSWDDVQTIRRAMSKSMGDEFFGKYLERFVEGAIRQGMVGADAKNVWDKICTFGSWAFNKSHAVSYGLISYWCAMLKARYPLEFAAACLRNASDEEQSIKMLQEVTKAGLEYVPVDSEKSGLTWSVVDGKLLGGLTNIKGVGPKKAEQILRCRGNGAARSLPRGLRTLLEAAQTPYGDIFPGQRRFADLYADPPKYNVHSGAISFCQDMSEPGEYVFIARIREKNQRDMNEAHSLAARGGRVIKRNNLFLNLVLEDDTGLVFATIGRFQYSAIGKKIIEEAKVGDWFLWKGKIEPKWQKVYIEKYRNLETDEWPK